jgi:hypothetical protein
MVGASRTDSVAEMMAITTSGSVSRGQSPTPWTCPLCGRPGRRSKEHVLPEWLWKSWDPDVRTIVSGEDHGRRIIKVQVCMDCNAWMNVTFENTTRELLNELRTGRRTVLSPDRQALLAGWLTKTLLMLNLWRDFDHDQYLKQEDYTSFRTTGQLPAGTRIWLGSIKDADPSREAAVIHAVPAIREHVSAPRSWRFPFGSSIHIFSFDQLVVVWVRDDRTDEAVRAPADPRRLIRRSNWQGLLVPIWPVSQPAASWPPPVPFDVTTYRRWSQLFAWR